MSIGSKIDVPAAKWCWGYYVLPILHGERIIARADLRLERGGGARPVNLRVPSLHHEPGPRRAAVVIGPALVGELARRRAAPVSEPMGSPGLKGRDGVAAVRRVGLPTARCSVCRTGAQPVPAALAKADLQPATPLDSRLCPDR